MGVMRLTKIAGISAVLLLAVMAGFSSEPAQAATARNEGVSQPLRIQLKWRHQFQFAGFYAAEVKGFFRDEGLDVRLVEGGPTVDPVTSVVSGGAEFGVGNSTLIIERTAGKPVVAVAAFFQRSPFVILARRDDRLHSVRDLEGRTLMLEEHAAELVAYLKLAGVDLDKVRKVPHTGDVRSLALGSPDRIDATSAYTSTEPYFAIRADIPVRIFDPRDIGIDFYGDTLFTTQGFAKSHPDAVRAMRRAVIRGWEYALAHQDEIISYILNAYVPEDDRTHLGFEAQVTKDLIGTDLVDIGYLSLSRWRHIADVFTQAGLMTDGEVPGDFMFEVTEPLPAWVYQWLGWLSALALLALLAAQWLYRLNKELKREISHRRALEEELRALATTDPLTGLANRRHLEDRAAAEIARSRRHAHDLGVILLDLNEFKELNDAHGHGFGDRCLQAVAGTCKSVLRDIDLAARYGGDEFLIMLPETDARSVQTVAERLRRMIGGLTIDPSDRPLSTSLGLGFLMPDDRGLDDIIARADADMYRDKRAGR